MLSIASKKVEPMRGLDTKAAAGVAFVLGAALSAQPLVAQDRPSARIYSLGGFAVSGIIPDYYTDLSINPAYACFAERLTCNYGRRNTDGFDMAFPHLTRDNFGGSVGGYETGTNEISVYGIRISGWHAALGAQWKLSQSEKNSIVTDLGTVTNPDISSRHDYTSNDNEFGRIDCVVGRPMGDRSFVGFRLQGRGYYESSSYATTQETDVFRNDPFMDIIFKGTTYYAEPRHGRHVCFDLQAGVTRMGGTGVESEIILRASHSSLDYGNQRYQLNVSEEYDAAGQPTSYVYDKTAWSDAREGSLWEYGLSVRHTLPGGIRVYSGGGLSRGSFDAEWTDSRRYINWNYYDRNRTIEGGFTGTGSQWEAAYFLKGGKTFSLLETLDLTVGLCGDFSRIQAEESPNIHYSQSLFGGDTIRIDQPSTLKYTGTGFSMYAPLSIEFRPASWFSFFTGFTLYGRWSKNVTEHPALSLFYYNPPYTSLVPGGAAYSSASPKAVVIPETSVADWTRSWHTGNSTTLGFSLHYGDRFFVDVYTEVEIIPALSSDRMIDVRYVF